MCNPWKKVESLFNRRQERNSIIILSINNLRLSWEMISMLKVSISNGIFGKLGPVGIIIGWS
jgi:hypothetical protein